ncbi:hypothetical protein [Nocardioides dongkuii]|uniref:hypothetical protein n=1 Tax=Nocardioides dongkuii TaxID=2760089 RepID=UPI0015FA3B05|nr:hypothetical protein [Nocardioides dongkuii]
MSNDDKKSEDKDLREPTPSPDSGFGHEESGQIEPIKSVETPLPESPAHEDDD